MNIKAFEIIAPDGKVVARFESDCTSFNYMINLAEDLVEYPYKGCNIKYIH